MNKHWISLRLLSQIWHYNLLKGWIRNIIAICKNNDKPKHYGFLGEIQKFKMKIRVLFFNSCSRKIVTIFAKRIFFNEKSDLLHWSNFEVISKRMLEEHKIGAKTCLMDLSISPSYYIFCKHQMNNSKFCQMRFIWKRAIYQHFKTIL